MRKQVNGSLSTENCNFILSNLVANDLVDDPDAETVDPVHVQADTEEAYSVQTDHEEADPFQADPEEADPFQADPFPIESTQIEAVQMQVEVVLSAGIIKGFFAHYLHTFCSFICIIKRQ
jgi:hypothetical protein